MSDERDFLRNELLAVAAAVVPDQRPVVTHDPGPIAPGVLFDGRRPATVARVAVQTGNPGAPDPAAEVEAAATALRARGWAADVVPAEDGHYRVAASRDGYDIAVHAWATDWRITFTGETPVAP
jgi:hypothetical protein